VNYTPDENAWESYKNLFEVTPQLLSSYYDKHPEIEKDKRWNKPEHRYEKERDGYT
jgi:hypothetical protein